MSSTAWDVAIVGAGPAGAATAIHAARVGRRVVVVDAAHFPRQKVCGEYLTPAAWRLLDELGVGDLAAQAVPLPTMELAASERRRATLEFAAGEEQPRALSRYALDARLVDEARRAGATFLLGRRVRRVVVERGHAVALECAGDAEHEPGERIAAKLIVAADGRRSVVVRDTGRLRHRDLGLVGFKRHVRCDAGRSRAVITMHALPGGYIGTCPTEDGLVNVCGVMPRRFVREARGDISAELREWLADRPTLRAYAEAEGDGPWHSMPDVSLQSARPHVAGVIYIGDARGTIEPLTGQGMTMALAAARLACERLKQVELEAFDAAAQAAYDAEWRALFARPIAAASWFGRLLRRPALVKLLITAGGPLPGLSDVLLRGAHKQTLTVAR
jgi:flavin-dependent dehydrogenase